MGTLRFFEEVVSFKIRRTFGFADYKVSFPARAVRAAHRAWVRVQAGCGDRLFRQEFIRRQRYE